MKKFSTILVAIFAISMVSGLLVSYLSNKATVEVDVESPMLIEVTGDSNINIVGGGTAEVQIRTTNLADVNVTGRIQNLVTNDLGLNCSDFTSVVVSTETNGTYVGTWDLIQLGLCSEVDNETISFQFGPQPTTTWISGQVDVMNITATFPINALGQYVLTSEIFI